MVVQLISALLLALAGAPAGAGEGLVPVRAGAGVQRLAPQAPAAPGPADARVRAAARAASDQAARRLAVTQAGRARHAAARARVAQQYEAQLAEIDRLKRSKASWRRDRLIREQMARSLETARKMEQMERILEQWNDQLRRDQAALLAAVEQELRTGADAARARHLGGVRGQLRRTLLPQARRIVLPELVIDPLADPEELEVQAALIAQSEGELLREATLLDRRAERYRRLARLQDKRLRAGAAGVFDDDRPRRGGGRGEAAKNARDAAGGGGTASAPESDGAAPQTGSDGPSNNPSPSPQVPPPGDTSDTGSSGGDLPPASDLADPAIVLADVVDRSTLDALRSAARSRDPQVKARATDQALAQVKERLERLRRQRALIEARARALRHGR